ncbi:MAG: hypothetical protein ABJF10_13670 [Chthoniobacter sp.]|uniref:hypothetical protein n=1 Tax=Chthoniobacter sp. TaxID=2510640 RepID=UPI0032AAEB1B
MNRVIPNLDASEIAQIKTIEQAKSYYYRVQRQYFHGVPGVGVAGDTFTRLSPLLERFRAAAPEEAVNLWVLPKGDGALLIATHLHQPSPGRALMNYLAGQPLDDLGQRFAARWKMIAEYYTALRCLYVLSEAPELQLELPETTER